MEKKHDYHLVDPSPWPVSIAFSAAFTAASGAAFIHEVPFAFGALGLGLILVIWCFYGWLSDVTKEAVEQNAHTNVVQNGIKIGMIVLIISEAMLFVAFFWSIFKSWLSPITIFNGVVPTIKATWPPSGIKTLNPFGVPLINTFILLLSGATLTWSHHSLMNDNKKTSVRMLFITICLGVLFTSLQAMEYYHALFPFKVEGQGSIYSSNFYMATGFHGAHVIVGTIFLTVCLFRMIKGSISKERHLGFELATWYWHFVDVVWLLLFGFLYIPSGM